MQMDPRIVTFFDLAGASARPISRRPFASTLGRYNILGRCAGNPPR
jgi:hypothetical protein